VFYGQVLSEFSCIKEIAQIQSTAQVCGGRCNCEQVTNQLNKIPWETFSEWSLGGLECKTKQTMESKDKQEVLLCVLLMLSHLRNLSSFITAVCEKLWLINGLEELLEEHKLLVCKCMVSKMYVEHKKVGLFWRYKKLRELSNSTERRHKWVKGLKRKHECLCKFTFCTLFYSFLKKREIEKLSVSPLWWFCVLSSCSAAWWEGGS